MTTPKTRRPKKPAASTPRPRLAPSGPSAPRTARLPARTAADPVAALIDLFSDAVATKVAARVAADDGDDGYYNQHNSPLSPRIYLDLIRDKVLPARLVGRARLVRRAVLHAWIETHPTHDGVNDDAPSGSGLSAEPPAVSEERRLDEVLNKNRVGRKG